MNMNVSKTNTGKLLVAVLAMAVVFAGCAVLLNDNVYAAEGDDQTGAEKSLDSLISESTDGKVVLEAGEYTLNSDITKAVTITGVEGTVIVLTNVVKITNNVTFENVEFSDSGSTSPRQLLNPYVNFDATENVTINFNNISFNENCDGDTIYLSPMSSTAKLTVNVNNSDCTNGTFVYMANESGAVLNFNNSDNADLNISSGSNDSAVEYGTDIIAGNSTLNNVWISSEKDSTGFEPPVLTIPAGEELTASNDIKVQGSMVIDGTVESKTMNVTDDGNVKLTGTLKAAVTAPANGFQYNGDATFEGTLNDKDVSTNWQTLPLIDGTVIDASSSIVASASQKVTVDGDVTVINGGVLQIAGHLIINENATHTLK